MKLVTPASLTQFGDEVSKKDFIRRVFVDAYKSSLSLIILDDIESMIEWNPVGPRFSNTILRTIVTMMRAPPPKGHRLLVLVTSSRRSILSQLDIVEAFDSEIPVPAVEDLRELGTVLKVARMFDPSEISEAIETVKEYTPSNSQTVGLGIKTILTVAEKAKLSDNPTQWFAEQLATQIMKYNTV
jgi:vesicle-fusing ATPase